MKPSTLAVLQIVTALLFASLMLVSAYLLKGDEHQWLITNLILTLYFVPFTWLSKLQKSSKGTCC